jgi:hypothetical protein
MTAAEPATEPHGAQKALSGQVWTRRVADQAELTASSAGDVTLTVAVNNPQDFQALEPFFRVIEEGLAGLVDGGHFFDLLAEDAVFEFIITVPGYPRRVTGRDDLIELYRGYQSTFSWTGASICGFTVPTTRPSRWSTRRKGK